MATGGKETMEPFNTFYTSERRAWRQWLADNFERKDEIWFVFPMKGSGEESLSYNDAVEEALCFGWIDSVIKHLDPLHRIQRFSPRRKGAAYSRPNIERLVWLESQGMIHPDVRECVLEVINAPYVFPGDLVEAIRSDEVAWENYQKLPQAYKRIRISYIDAARNRPLEFKKRLDNFIRKTRENNLVAGFGGIEKYYR